MNRSMIFVAISALFVTTSHAAAPTNSPYVGQETRAIKALSPEEVEGLLVGKGLGFAKAAELNGYPGPAHVLELAQQLQLSDAQRVATSAIYEEMQRRAAIAGAQLVEEESKLDRSFADRAITRDALSASVARIGELQAEVRRAHLDAHLAQIEVLTAEQRASYVRLRGYLESQPTANGHHMTH